jgi:hypothetical protein
VKFLLICEGSGDDEDLKILTVRVLREAHLCLRDDDSLPAWLEYKPGRSFLRWSSVKGLCEKYKVPRVQRLGGGLGYRQARMALQLLSALPSLNLRNEGVRVVMVHDSDRGEGWPDSFERARNDWLPAVRADGADADLAFGVAHPEHEAWVLAAFEPRSKKEKARLDELTKRLKFDPTLHGERLTPGLATNPRDAKKVLDELCPDADRRRALLREAPLELLHSRGEKTGLRAFLDELRARAANAFGGPSPGG